MTLLNSAPSIIQTFEVGESGSVLEVGYLNLVNPPIFRPKGAPGYKSIYGMLVPFKTCLNAPIFKLSYPPFDPQVSGNSLGLLPIRWPMHKPLNLNILAYPHSLLLSGSDFYHPWTVCTAPYRPTANCSIACRIIFDMLNDWCNASA